jgi:hypothetical protein
LKSRAKGNIFNTGNEEIDDMEQKGQYTAVAQVNSKPSTPDGNSDTDETKRDAKADSAAIFCSVIATLMEAGWDVKIGQTSTRQAYVVISGARWEEKEDHHLLVEA